MSYFARHIAPVSAKPSSFAPLFDSSTKRCVVLPHRRRDRVPALPTPRAAPSRRRGVGQDPRDLVDVLAGVRLRRVGAPLALAVRRLEPRHDLRQLVGLLRIGRRRQHERDLQQVQLAPLVGRHLHRVELHRLLARTSRRRRWPPGSRARRCASVSSVMKFCCTQPACACCMPSFSIVALAVVEERLRARRPSGAGLDGVCAQPIARGAARTTSEQRS